jgi:hypothetical protein
MRAPADARGSSSPTSRLCGVVRAACGLRRRRHEAPALGQLGAAFLLLRTQRPTPLAATLRVLDGQLGGWEQQTSAWCRPEPARSRAGSARYGPRVVSELLRTLASLAVSLGIGWSVVDAWWPHGDRGRTLALRLGTSLALGLGISSIAFAAGLVVLPQARPWSTIGIELALAAIAGIAFVARQRRRRAGSVSSAHDDRVVATGARSATGAAAAVAGVAFLIAGVVALATFVRTTTAMPFGTGDALLIWNLRASFLFDSGAAWTDAFGPAFVGSHRDYPLLVPGAVASRWEWAGERTGVASACVGAAFLLATLLVVVGAAGASGPESSTRIRARTAGSVLLGLGGFVPLAASQYADVPLACYLVVFVVILVRHTLRPDGAEATAGLVLAGAALGCAFWTKNEAVVVGGVATGLFASGRVVEGRLRLLAREILALAAGAAAPLGCLVAFKVGLAPPNDLVEQLGSADLLARAFDASRYLEVGNGVWRALVGQTPWVLAATGIVGIACRSAGPRFLGALLALSVLGYGAVFVLTSADIEWHVATALDRLLLQLWPIFVVAATACGLQRGGAAVGRSGVARGEGSSPRASAAFSGLAVVAAATALGTFLVGPDARTDRFAGREPYAVAIERFAPIRERVPPDANLGYVGGEVPADQRPLVDVVVEMLTAALVRYVASEGRDVPEIDNDTVGRLLRTAGDELLARAERAPDGRPIPDAAAIRADVEWLVPLGFVEESFRRARFALAPRRTRLCASREDFARAARIVGDFAGEAEADRWIEARAVDVVERFGNGLVLLRPR